MSTKTFEEKLESALSSAYDEGHTHCEEEYCDAYWSDQTTLSELVVTYQADLDAKVREAEQNKPILIGTVFGQDLYMVQEAHEELQAMGVFDQSKDLEDYLANPEVTRLLREARKESHDSGFQEGLRYGKFLEKNRHILHLRSMLGGYPTDAPEYPYIKSMFERELTKLTQEAKS